MRFHQDLIERCTDDPSRLAVTDHDQLVGYVDFTPDDRAAVTNAASRHMLVAAGFGEVGPCGTDDYRGEIVTIIEYELLLD